MKLLFAIPHFYKKNDDSFNNRYGSSESPPERRVRALCETVLTLHQTFGKQHCEINIADKTAIPVGGIAQHDIDIVICTTGEHHVLDHLPISKGLYHHHPTDAEPLKLGFECHDVLKNHLNQYDYYCYLEDDLLITDNLFFEKLNQFNAQTETIDLLQAHRYEVQHKGPYFKAYVDGDLKPEVTERYQDISENPNLNLKLLGMDINFRRPLNPHSASFFLSNDQLNYWMSQDYYLDRDTSFVGPLESAASLGIMKTFRIYKPDRSNPDFLEIKHADNRFIHQIGTVVKDSTNKEVLMK